MYRNTKYPAFNKAKFKTALNQIKIYHAKKFAKHVKRQKNSTHDKKINQSVESNPELTNWLELASKTFTTIIFYMLKS